jgi:hypothetical protein
MASIEYISDNEFILKYQEPDINILSRIEFDMNILRLINKRFNTHEKGEYPPEVEYTFKIIKFKSTKITLIDKYNNGEIKKLYVDVELNSNISKCIII